MSKDNKRLGRGLEALLGKVAAAQTGTVDRTESGTTDASSNVDSNAISRNFTSSHTPFPSIVSFPQSDLEEESAEKKVQTRTGNVKRSSSALLEEEKDRALAKFSNGQTATEIQVGLIDRNPFQPRLDFDPAELDELKNSLAQHGLLQPIVVRQNGKRYEIIAGERRFRAAQEVGWKTIPALIFRVDDRQMAELALTENIQRRDLNPIEKATAFRNYLDLYGGTQEELAQRLTLDRSTVSNLMRLLELHEDVQQMTRSGQITMGHARALLPLDELDQLEMSRRIVDEQLSVRQTETIVKEFLAEGVLPPKVVKTAPEVSPRIRDLEQQFRSWLGMKVKLTSNDKGKGKLVLQFNSNDEFERIYQAFKPKDF